MPPAAVASPIRTTAAPEVLADPARLVIRERPDLATLSPLVVADRLRGTPDATGLPGLALLESRRLERAGRWSYLTADPVAVLDVHDADLRWIAEARALLGRLSRERSPAAATHPPFLGGLVGYIGYELGGAWERPPVRAADHACLPLARLALYDWVVAWDGRTRRCWVAARAVDGDLDRAADRLAEVEARLDATGIAAAGPDRSVGPVEPFRSLTSRAAWIRAVESIRDAIGDGEIYQANLSRRLEASWQGDAWSLYRRLSIGDPVPFQAFLDVGAGRAIVSASPEPFLRADADGRVTTDPIKGTRRRGPRRDEDRRLARELLGSAKDRAENLMIVDVLRNDLGRACAPGSIRVPRLCRLERTDAVQHLVSTVTGRLAQGRDAFDLLAAALPGGSVTGAPKQRAIDLLARLEPVARGPYTGAIGWIGPDGALATSIAIRTFVADGETLALHVGGGITWRSDPAAEWEETVAKAAGPLRAIGTVVDEGSA